MNEPIQKNRNSNCNNCGYSMGDFNYCSECGQKNTDGRISVKEFFSVFLLTVFNLESKFFKTLRDIFSPGKLTIEWFKGRHKPYFHPVRLFIITALILIAALSLFMTEDSSFDNGDYEQAQKEIYRKQFIKEINNYSRLYSKDEKAKKVVDSLAKEMSKGSIVSGRKTMISYGVKNGLPDLEDKSTEEIIALYKNEFGPKLTDSIITIVKSKRRLTQDSVQLINLLGDAKQRNISNEDFLTLTPIELADKYQIVGFFNRIHFKQRIRLQKSSNNIGPFVLGNSLWVALLMMPFLALILKLVYIRHNYYYLEHLVFSFHAHSFAFILFATICIFMKLVYVHPVIVFFGFFFLFIYLFMALRRVYQQSILKTISKLLFVNIIYLCLFCSFALLGLIGSLFLF